MSRLERHAERHLVARIGWLRAAVLGANDGLVSTASLIVGVAAAEAATGPGHDGHPSVHTWHRDLPQRSSSIRSPGVGTAAPVSGSCPCEPHRRPAQRTQLDPLAVLDQPTGRTRTASLTYPTIA